MEAPADLVLSKQRFLGKAVKGLLSCLRGFHANQDTLFPSKLERSACKIFSHSRKLGSRLLGREIQV